MEETYYDRKAEFKEFIHKIEEQEAAAAAPLDQTLNRSVAYQANQASGSATISNSLPRIQVPKFSGRLSDWSNFRDLFRSMVHRSEDVSAVLKFYHLKTGLEGEALNMIKSYEITEENYTKA